MQRSRLLVRALWVTNALAFAVLLAALLVRFGSLAGAGGAALPDIRPLQIAALAVPAAGGALGERNPFDAYGAAWREAAAEQARGEGDFKGVIILPGLRLAITDRGSIRVGDALGPGRIVAVENGRVVVDTGAGRQPLQTPGARRPRMEDLNRPGTDGRAPAKGNS